MPGANRYTTTELLDAIRREGNIPAAQGDYDDEDLLAYADTEIWGPILKLILSGRENYYLAYSDIAVNATGLYSIPTRAWLGKLADIHHVQGTSIAQVTRTEIGQLGSTTSAPNGGTSFYLYGNKLMVLNNPTSGYIRLWYFCRASALVPEASAAQVLSIAGNIVTVSATPSTFTTAKPMDFIKDQPGFDWLGLDSTPTLISGEDITFTSVPTDLAEGDWIALAGQTPVPQVPVEFRSLVSLRVAERWAASQGYSDKAKLLEGRRKDMEEAMSMISPRVEEEQKQIVPDGSFLANGRSARFGWRAD